MSEQAPPIPPSEQPSQQPPLSEQAPAPSTSGMENDASQQVATEQSNNTNNTSTTTTTTSNEANASSSLPPLAAPSLGPRTYSQKLRDLPPTDIVPLFISTSSQQLFKVKVNEDVSESNRFKILPKADLQSDLYTRAAVSDFAPAKKWIQDFPGEEMLLVYDHEWKFGQNFFLVVTESAMVELLKQESKELEQIIEATPTKPVGWVCLGSDKEIDTENFKPTRDKIHIKVSRKRREFGAPVKFTDRDAHEAFMECRPFRDPAYEVSRMEIQVGVQAVPETRETLVQTNWNRPLNFATQYEPIQLPKGDAEIMLLESRLGNFLKDSREMFESALQQNEIVDIFTDDYAALGDEDLTVESGSRTTLQEYQSYTDLKNSKDHSISCVAWHPTQKGVVAISCVQRVTFDEKIEMNSSVRSKQALILIWSFHDPIRPQLILEAPDDIMSFQFNPVDPSLVIGGCVNGQLVLWDISEYQDKLRQNRKTRGTENDNNNSKDNNKNVDTPVLRYFGVSSIEFSHKAPITDLMWLPRHLELNTHNGEILDKGEHGDKQLVTTSLDGQVFFWDTRFKKELKLLDLTWKPFLRVPLSAADNTFDYGLTHISLYTIFGDKIKSATESSNNLSNSAMADSVTSASGSTGKAGKSGHLEKPAERFGTTKFFCATEEGELLYADWCSEKGDDKGGSKTEHIFGNAHFGPMSDLQRSPFFQDIVLSVGGSNFAIWKEKVTSGPLLLSAPSSTYLTGGKWSPTRPGVFYISKADGTIEVWDLLDRSHSPSNIQNVSSSGVSSMSIQVYSGKSTHQFIGAGDDGGTLHVIEVPRNLIKPAKNEKAFIRGFFEREVKRLQYVQGRKLWRQQEKAKVEPVAAAAPAAEPASAKQEPAQQQQQQQQTAKTDDEIRESEALAFEKEYKAIEMAFLGITEEAVEA